MDVSAILSTVGSPGYLPRDTAATGEGARRPDQAAEDRKKVSGQFEAILVRQLLSESVGSMLGSAGGSGGNVYGYMLTDVLSEKLTAGQGLGLGRMLEQQLSPRGQPASSATSAEEDENRAHP